MNGGGQNPKLWCRRFAGTTISPAYSACGREPDIRVLTSVWPGFSETRIFVKLSFPTVDREVISESMAFGFRRNPACHSRSSILDLESSTLHDGTRGLTPPARHSRNPGANTPGSPFYPRRRYSRASHHQRPSGRAGFLPRLATSSRPASSFAID